MTQAQAQQFERGLARASRDDCYIIGRGIVRATGLEYYGVQSGANTYHVAIHNSHLVCDCKAGQQGNYCKHRSLTRQHMENCTVKDLARMPDLSEPNADELAEVVGDHHSDEWPDERDNALLAYPKVTNRMLRNTR